MEEWFTLNKELVRTMRDVGCVLGTNPMQKIPSAVLKYATTALENFKNQKINKDAKKKKRSVEVPQIESSAVLKISTCYQSTLPKTFRKGEVETEWMVVSCLGKEKSFQMALENETLIPIGGVAARLKKISENRL